jgi:Holliday junction resolvasome RuvABC endonuclease subunit
MGECPDNREERARMNILALDLGSSTGWARSGNGEIYAGTWELATAKNLKFQKKLRMDRRLDIRVANLVNKLLELHQFEPIDWIFFEDVRFGKSLAQVQLWSAFRGAIWTFAHIKGVQVDCLDTGKLKKWATGSGSAEKPAMAAALIVKHSDRYSAEKGLVKDRKLGTLLDDNAVDAIHLLNWALQLFQ